MMQRSKDLVSDLRVAAIAPAVVGHAIAFGILMSVMPSVEKDPVQPVAVEFVLVEPELAVWPVPPEPVPSAENEPDQAGTASESDPRLGEPEGGAIEQAAIPEDAPFQAFEGVDVAEATVPGQVNDPREALQSGLMGDGGDQLRAIRVALRRQACRKLTEKPDPTCPPVDPFIERMEIAALRNAPPLLRPTARVFAGGAIVPTTVRSETSFLQVDLPAGMDASLFALPSQPGAYSVWHIRNGQAPLWHYALEQDLAELSTVN